MRRLHFQEILLILFVSVSCAHGPVKTEIPNADWTHLISATFSSKREEACDLQLRHLKIKGSEFADALSANASPLEMISPRGYIANTVDFYSWNELESQDLEAEDKSALKSFVEKLITFDRDRILYGYDFESSPVKQGSSWRARKNGVVIDRRKKVISLPLDLSKVSDADAGILKAVTAARWKNSEIGLRIIAVKGAPYSVRYSYFNGVEHDGGEIHLRQPLEPGVMAHEIGHVLGFLDDYSVQFSRSDCIYWIYRTPASTGAMSGGTLNEVEASHLIRAYGSSHTSDIQKH
ncbi:MAG: hypothetical protein EOP06_17900 [Proteobacteria bacterium]|nr:MAG: hypothetical protein EOP06_17900 [Pseudomonadota bacterium]